MTTDNKELARKSAASHYKEIKRLFRRAKGASISHRYRALNSKRARGHRGA